VVEGNNQEPEGIRLADEILSAGVRPNKVSPALLAYGSRREIALKGWVIERGLSAGENPQAPNNGEQDGTLR
jgi:hypothetical protein